MLNQIHINTITHELFGSEVKVNFNTEELKGLKPLSRDVVVFNSEIELVESLLLPLSLYTNWKELYRIAPVLWIMSDGENLIPWRRLLGLNHAS